MKKLLTITVITGSLVLACLAAAWALLFPPYRPLAPTGPHAWATARYSYVDEGRLDPFRDDGAPRVIHVTFWYPQDAAADETCPLVLFSHGGLGTETSNESLFMELASHGYVVGSIAHPYHALYTKNEDGHITLVDKTYFQELQREDARQDPEQSYLYYQEWMATRTADINFALDTILQKAATGEGGVYSLIDGGRIGMIGHSLGGSAALAMPRRRDDIAAVIALEAPFLDDIVGVADGAFVWRDEPYPVPVLNIYSDSSWAHLGEWPLTEWPQYGRNAQFLADPPPAAVSLHLPGTGHFSLTDLALASPRLTRLLEGGRPDADYEAYLRQVNQACLAFFERELKPQ